MSVTLINTSKRIKVITLLHREYCEKVGRCGCVLEGIRKKRIPSSITIPAGTTVSGLEDVILLLPDTKRYLRTNAIIAQQTPTKSAASSRRKKQTKKRSPK